MTQLTPRNPWTIVLLISTVATAYSVMQGLTYPLLALLLERAGASHAAIGANAAMMPLGMLMVAPVAPRIVRAFGPLRTGLASLVSSALCLAAIALLAPGAVWMPFRFVMGVDIALIYVVTDTAVTTVAHRAMRGRALAVYGSFISVGYALGTYILALLGTTGAAPFAAGIGCIAAATIPLALVRRSLPAAPETSRSVFGMVRVIPGLLFTVFIVGLVDQASLSLAPVYAVQHGYSPKGATLVMLVMIAGNLVLQYPLCWLADRFSRLGASILCGGVATLSILAWPFLAGHALPFGIAVFLWGGCFYTVYTLCIVRLGDRLSGAALVAGNAAFGAMWGISGCFGPPMIGAAMDGLGTEALPILSAMLYAALTLSFLASPREPAADLG